MGSGWDPAYRAVGNQEVRDKSVICEVKGYECGGREEKKAGGVRGGRPTKIRVAR